MAVFCVHARDFCREPGNFCRPGEEWKARYRGGSVVGKWGKQGAGLFSDAPEKYAARQKVVESRRGGGDKRNGGVCLGNSGSVFRIRRKRKGAGESECVFRRRLRPGWLRSYPAQRGRRGAFRSGQRAGGRNRGARRGETGKEGKSGRGADVGLRGMAAEGARYGRARASGAGPVSAGFPF